MQLPNCFSFIVKFKGLLSPLPCPTSLVALYIVWLSKPLKYSCITNYASTLNLFLKAEGSVPIDYSSHTIKTVMGREHVLGYLVKWTTPLLLADLLNTLSFMSSSIGHVCTRATILTGFRALLRKNQLTDSDAVLHCRDFILFPQWGLLLTISPIKAT